MLTILCIGCRVILHQLPGKGRPSTAKTVGQCCAGGYGLRQSDCYRPPPRAA